MPLSGLPGWFIAPGIWLADSRTLTGSGCPIFGSSTANKRKLASAPITAYTGALHIGVGTNAAFTPASIFWFFSARAAAIVSGDTATPVSVATSLR